MASSRVRKALIPAAGRGTRFLPVTKAVPKELLPIVSTPALEYVVAEASRYGACEVLLVVGPGKESVAEYFAPDPDLEAALQAKGDEQGLASVRRAQSLATISEVEQAEPRGLGDAIAHGAEFADGDAVAVLLPDDLIDDRDDLLGRMLDIYDEYGGVVLGLMEVSRAEIRKYGSVAITPTDSADVVTITDLVEKPDPDLAPSTLAVIGRYVLPPEIFGALEETTPGAGGEIQVTDGIKRLVEAGVPTHGVIFRGRRYDAGDRLEYLRAVVQHGVRHVDIGPAFSAWLREYVATALMDSDGSG